MYALGKLGGGAGRRSNGKCWLSELWMRGHRDGHTNISLYSDVDASGSWSVSFSPATRYVNTGHAQARIVSSFSTLLFESHASLV